MEGHLPASRPDWPALRVCGVSAPGHRLGSGIRRPSAFLVTRVLLRHSARVTRFTARRPLAVRTIRHGLCVVLVLARFLLRADWDLSMRPLLPSLDCPLAARRFHSATFPCTRCLSAHTSLLDSAFLNETG